VVGDLFRDLFFQLKFSDRFMTIPLLQRPNRQPMPPFDRSRFKLARRALLEGNKRLMSVLGRTE